MKLFSVTGRLINKNVSKYRIDWEGKSRSKLQFAVKKFLSVHWKNHIVYEEFPVYGTLLKVDFLNATKKIAIEVQGTQHNEFNKFFHDNSQFKYLASIKRDQKKLDWLVKNGFKIVEILETEVPYLTIKLIQEKTGISII